MGVRLAPNPARSVMLMFTCLRRKPISKRLVSSFPSPSRSFSFLLGRFDMCDAFTAAWRWQIIKSIFQFSIKCLVFICCVSFVQIKHRHRHHRRRTGWRTGWIENSLNVSQRNKLPTRIMTSCQPHTHLPFYSAQVNPFCLAGMLCPVFWYLNQLSIVLLPINVAGDIVDRPRTRQLFEVPNVGQLPESKQHFED